MVAPDFVNRGRNLSAGGRHLEAVKVCRLGLLANPSALDGRLVLGQALLALARHDEVLAEVRVILQARPDDVGALRLKGEALLGRGDSAQALDIFEALSRTSSDPVLIALTREARDSASNATTATLGDDDTSISWTRDYPSHLADSDSVTGHFSDYAEPKTLPADAATEIEEPSFAMATADTMLVAQGLSNSVDDGPEDDFESSAGTIEVDPSLMGHGASSSWRPPITRTPPISSARRTALPTPYREPLASEASSGSIELSVVDLEPIERLPPGDESVDFSSEELSIDDLIPATDSAAELIPATDSSALAVSPLSASALPGGLEEVRGFDSDFVGTPSDPTHAYGPERVREKLRAFAAEAPLFLEREPDRPKSSSFPTDMPRQAASEPPQRTTPESPRALSPERERPSAPLNLAPEVSDLFPEDEDGVSKLAILDELSGAPVPLDHGPLDHGPLDHGPLDHGPPRGIDAEPIDAGLGAPMFERAGSRHEDMRTIRAGLGLSPDPSQQAMAVVPPLGPAISPPPPRPVMRAAPPTARVAPPPRMSSANTRPAARVSIPLLVGLGVLLIGGGVAGGVMLRGWRTERSLSAAVDRAAALAASGSYLDHLRARSLLDRAFELEPREDLRLARAHVRAALSAEFGITEKDAEKDAEKGAEKGAENGAEKGAEKVPEPIEANDNRPDAFATLIYRALARGDADSALVTADAYLAARPKSAKASYLRGLALADLGQLEAAAKALRVARTSPLARAHLADVLRLSGAPAAAAEEAGEGDLPAILIARSRALARAGALPSGDEPESTLRRMVADAGLPPAEQTLGVSPSQGQSARLALIEVAIARGRSELARSELLALADLKLDAGTPFRLAYSEALLRTGDSIAAAEQYKAVAAAWPESPRTHILGARIALARGDARAARVEIAKVENIGALPRALAVRGQLALLANRLEDAKRDLDDALAAAPGLEDAVLARARLDLASGDADAALARIEALPAGLFGSARDILKAQALRAAGRFEEARAVLVGAASSEAAEGMLELARLEVAGGRMAAAIKAYDAVLDKYSTNGSAELERAVLLLDNGKSAEARKTLEKLATERESDPTVLLATARARTLLGDAGAAAPLLDATAKLLDAPVGAIARERGRALLRQRIYDRAMVELNTAIAALPNDFETHELLMEAYLGAGDAEGAEALVSKAMVSLGGRTYDMSLLRGIKSLLVDKSADAEISFLAARASQPAGLSRRDEANLNYWLGRSYEINGKLGKARSALKSALELEPMLARAHLSLGDVELQDRKLKLAEKQYKRAAELDPVANPRAFLMLGQIYVSSRRQPQAKEALEQYLGLDPLGAGAAEAKELLAQIR